jgi:hypothetical protein
MPDTVQFLKSKAYFATGRGEIEDLTTAVISAMAA